jgi:hypothetical protein
VSDAVCRARWLERQLGNLTARTKEGAAAKLRVPSLCPGHTLPRSAIADALAFFESDSPVGTRSASAAIIAPDDILARVGLRAAADGLSADHPDANVIGLAVETLEARATHDALYREVAAAHRPAWLSHAEAWDRAVRASQLCHNLEDCLAATRAVTRVGVAAKLRATLATRSRSAWRRNRLLNTALRDALALVEAPNA